MRSRLAAQTLVPEHILPVRSSCFLAPAHPKDRNAVKPLSFTKSEEKSSKSGIVFACGKRLHICRRKTPTPLDCVTFCYDLLKTATCPSSHLPADSALQNEGGFRRHWRRFSAADCLRFQQPFAACLLEARRGQTGCENLSWGAS